MSKTYKDGLREAMEIVTRHQFIYERCAKSEDSGSEDARYYEVMARSAGFAREDISDRLTMQEKNDAGQ